MSTPGVPQGVGLGPMGTGHRPRRSKVNRTRGRAHPGEHPLRAVSHQPFSRDHHHPLPLARPHSGGQHTSRVLNNSRGWHWPSVHGARVFRSAAAEPQPCGVCRAADRGRREDRRTTNDERSDRRDVPSARRAEGLPPPRRAPPTRREALGPVHGPEPSPPVLVWSAQSACTIHDGTDRA